MQKKVILLAYLLFAGIVASYSQQLVQGKVSSSEDKEAIPGVNIIKKGTSTGTITDADGLFKINVDKNDTLVFSFIGMTSKEIIIKDFKFLDVELNPITEEIHDVVVTALGLKREEKALGYAVQNVKGDQIAKVKEIDVINALSGKVSGVNIIQGDGAVGGGGSRIVIRGESSLAGNNDPLFIINGVRGNANDVAADDIESISVLKGPAAAALYGADAGAGVVLITSKSGKGKKGTEVEVNSNMTFQTPLVLPDYQNKYGMGKTGEYSYYDGNGGGTFDDTEYNWGPEFDGENRPQFTGNDPWLAYPNNVGDFYQLGHIYTNNISVSNSSEKGNFRFSYTNTDQRGVLPNNGLQKNRFDLNSNFQITSRLNLTVGLNYNRTYCPNDRQADPRFIPRSIDISALKDYWIPGMEGEQQMNYRRSDNNPYFILYENRNSYTDNKIIANVSLQYEPIKNLTVMGRYGYSYTNNDYNERKAYSTYDKDDPKQLGGYYKSGLANNKEATAEFLASYSKNISVINYKLSFGGTHYRKEYNKVQGDITGLKYADVYNLNNRLNPISIDNYISQLERNSLYGFLNLDYMGKIFLDLTTRKDWSSTLHPDNNSFFYPSVALSGLMSEIFNLPSVFNFWKIRGSWAQVGKDIAEPFFVTEEKAYWAPNSITGIPSALPTDVKTDPYLKPEITNGFEVGTDLRMFNNRLGFDVAVYYSVTRNQILKTSVSSTTGFNYFMMNAGKISSKGIEATINGTPVKTTSGLTWDVQLNWSIDRTYVDELIADNPSINKVQSVNSFLYIEDRVGQRRGTFYGQAYVRAPNGERVYTPSGDTRLTSKQALGNYNPDWMASLNNTVTYKNLSLSCLFDLRWGGLIYNEIERKLNMYGLSKATLLNDRVGIVPDGMVEESDGTYRKLTLADLEEYGKSGQTGQEYWATQMEESCPENELINDTYLKLREARISYVIPKKLLEKIHIKDATVSLIGRNLVVWSKVKHIDPETFGYASEGSDFGYSTKVPGYANSNIPSLRSFGFSLNFKF